MILEVPPNLIFQDFVTLNRAHHWWKVSVVIYAVLNTESRKGGSGHGDQADLCTLFYLEPLLTDTRKCECFWGCVSPAFPRLKMEFSGTSKGLIVSRGDFQCGFLNLISAPHHKHVSRGRQ